MKKTVLIGFMVSIMVASGAALADSAALTTQGYVDAGLKAVYKAVDNVKADKETVNELSATVATKADADSVYSKEDVDSTFATKEDLHALETTPYTAIENGGLTINENNQIGLDIEEPNENSIYVYKNGEWAEYSVNSSFPEESELVQGD